MGTAQTTLQNAIDLKASQADLNAANAAIAQNAEDIATKANAADVYTKTAADEKFQTLEKAAADATAATNYTNTKVQELADTLGGTGEDGSSTGLVSTVTAQGNRISDLEGLVGSEKVADQIAGALEEYATTAVVESKDAATLQSAKDYADGLASNYDVAGAATTALADAKAYTDEKVTDMATNASVDTKLADYAKTSELNATYATDAEVAGVKTELQGAIDGKQATLTETQLAAVNSGVTSETVAQVALNKTATETNASAITAINNSDVMTSGITAEKRAAYDQAVSDLATKITMPEICQSKNCVLSTLNGVPTWVEITIPIE